MAARVAFTNGDADSNIRKIAASAIRGEARPDDHRTASGSISGAASASTQTMIYASPYRTSGVIPSKIFVWGA
jgi:hypothetical protein